MDGDKAEKILRRHWESLNEDIKKDYSEEYLERCKGVKDGEITKYHKTDVQYHFNNMYQNRKSSCLLTID